MRKIRKINVFSMMAVLVLVFILGCSFIPTTVIRNEAQTEDVEFADNSQSNETQTSSAVFINPELEMANN